MKCILFPALQINSSKTLASSLLRNLTTAELCCWKTNPQPLFRVERKGMSEIVTDQKISAQLHSFCDLDPTLLELHANDTIILMNPSALCLRNPDHLCSELMESEFPSIQPELRWMEDLKERIRGSAHAVLLSEEELTNYGHRFVASPGLVACQKSCLERLLSVWKQA